MLTRPRRDGSAQGLAGTPKSQPQPVSGECVASLHFLGARKRIGCLRGRPFAFTPVAVTFGTAVGASPCRFFPASGLPQSFDVGQRARHAPVRQPNNPFQIEVAEG